MHNHQTDDPEADHAGPALSGPYDVAAFYHFGALPDYASLQAPLTALCESRGVMGICLLAAEGINGTLAGLPKDMQAVLQNQLEKLRVDLVQQTTPDASQQTTPDTT